MESLHLTFTADGTGHCLYSELIELQALGRLHCRRASTVEFDPAEQQWQVHRPDGTELLFSSPSREACLRWERQHLQPL